MPRMQDVLTHRMQDVLHAVRGIACDGFMA